MREQFRRVLADAFGIARSPSMLNLYVVAVRPAQLLQAVQERHKAGLPFRIVRGRAMSTPMRRIRALLRPCSNRPHEPPRRRAAR